MIVRSPALQDARSYILFIELTHQKYSHNVKGTVNRLFNRKDNHDEISHTVPLPQSCEELLNIFNN